MRKFFRPTLVLSNVVSPVMHTKGWIFWNSKGSGHFVRCKRIPDYSVRQFYSIQYFKNQQPSNSLAFPAVFAGLDNTSDY